MRAFGRGTGMLARLIVALFLLTATIIDTGLASAAEPSAQTLRISGQRQTIELGPVHVATMRMQTPPNPVVNGAIPNLWLAPDAAPGTRTTDLANNAETQALNASLAHPDLRIILTVAEGHYRIVARRSAGIGGAADLKGKRIATMARTSSAFHLHKVLARAGLVDGDVTIVPVPRPRDISLKLINREVDALAIWEPEAEIAAAALGSDAVIFGGDAGYHELFNLNTTAAALADPAKRRAIVEFVANVMQASRDLRRDPADAQGLVAEATGYPLDLIKTAWREHRFPAALAPDLLDTLDEEEKWLAQQANRPARDRKTLRTLIDPTIEAEARQLLAKRGIPGGPAG